MRHIFGYEAAISYKWYDYFDTELESRQGKEGFSFLQNFQIGFVSHPTSCCNIYLYFQSQYLIKLLAKCVCCDNILTDTIVTQMGLFHIKSISCSFQGIKRPERDIDHAPLPSSAGVKNEWR